MRTLHLRNQANIADFRTTSGSLLALASARALKKLLASADHLPPTSQPSTTNLARPMAPASSGYVLSLRLRACTSAAPLVVAHCLLGVPSRRIGEIIVVSMANCAPLNRGRPSTTTSRRRLSTCLSGRRSISCTLTFTVTRPPASRHTRAAALSRANPRRPKTPATEQAARWWPRESIGRPHRQIDDDRERGCQRRRRSKTRNSCGWNRDSLESGMHVNGIPAMGPCCKRINAWCVTSSLGLMVSAKQERRKDTSLSNSGVKPRLREGGTNTHLRLSATEKLGHQLPHLA